MSTIIVPAKVKGTPVAAGAGHEAAHTHHQLGFWQKYIFSQDHKVIGIQFMFMSMFFLLVGGGLAMIVRMQLGWPGHTFGFLNILSAKTVSHWPAFIKFFIPDIVIKNGFLPSTMVAGGVILP